ncbi:MAG: CPBP family intramembrane metalloprotease [Desulfobacterium sp.]|nr:CPBP family intramembrane metalloprotease [Desulfobacterium sp.]
MTGQNEYNSSRLVIFSLAMVFFCELVAAQPFSGLSPLEKTLFLRVVQAGLLVLLIRRHSQGLALAGMTREHLGRGIRVGLVWSGVFGLTVGICGGGLFLTGINPLEMVSAPIPFKGRELIFFFITGGLVAPVAEEIFFRGIIYGYLRCVSVPMALALTTLIFALCHARSGGLPLFQMVGGLVFALAFERSKSIAAPIIIHVLGNLALFSISVYTLSWR